MPSIRSLTRDRSAKAPAIARVNGRMIAPTQMMTVPTPSVKSVSSTAKANTEMNMPGTTYA